MICILLGEGFEEVEAIAPGDLLRRAGLDVCYVGVDSLEVKGAHGIVVKADCTLDQINGSHADVLVLPGGMDGVRNIVNSQRAADLIRSVYENHCIVAAICAAPMALSYLNMLEGKQVTCYPGMEGTLIGANVTPEKKTVRDGRLLTGQGPGAAIDFALALVEMLKGPEAMEAVAQEIHYGDR